MKRNILTVVVLALALINVVLSGVIIFAIVPTAMKTNKLITRVAQIIDLELESPEEEKLNLSPSDIEVYDIEGKLTINLKKSDDQKHYAFVYVSLSLNKKHKDYEDFKKLISQYENDIKEFVTDEFNNYTIDEVDNNK